jgi:hypothetical protein
VDDLCHDVRWTYGLPIKTVSPPALLDLYARVQREQAAWAALLKHGAAEMRKRALKNHYAFDSLMPVAAPRSSPTI